VRKGRWPTPHAISLYELLDPVRLLAGTQVFDDLDLLATVTTYAMPGASAKPPSECIADLKALVGAVHRARPRLTMGPGTGTQNLGQQLKSLSDKMAQVQKVISLILAFSLAMGKVRRRMDTRRERFIRAYLERATEALAATSIAQVFREEILIDLATELFDRAAAPLESEAIGAIETSTSLSLTLQVALAEMRAEYLEASDRCLGFLVEPPSMLTTSPTPASNTLTSTFRSTGPTRVPGRPYFHITFNGAFHG